jgi:hypothetical protein
VKVTLVPPDQVDSIWPAVVPYMEQAAKHTYGRYISDDILTALKNYEHHLWIAYDGQGIIRGAVVTALKHYPRLLALDLAFLGGVEGMSWKDEMLRVLQCWAYDNGCDVVESSGRLGWSKIFKGDGYKPLWQMFELPVGGTGIGG